MHGEPTFSTLLCMLNETNYIKVLEEVINTTQGILFSFGEHLPTQGNEVNIHQVLGIC